MYCRNCGTYNEEDANYCEECGFEIIHAKEEKGQNKTSPKVKKQKKVKKVKQHKKHSKNKKPKEKKSKAWLVFLLIIMACLGGTYYYLNKITAKEEVAKKYFEDKMSGDAARMYPYYEVEESEFANESIFKKIMADDTKKEAKVKNYKVQKTEESSDGLTATVTIHYTLEGSSDTKVETILLHKTEKKAYYIFDKWEVSKDSYKTIRDFKIYVMKGATLTLEGKKVDQKYLDKEASTSTLDVYVIPTLFASTYTAKADLPLGFTIEQEINTNQYSKRESILVTKENIPEATKKKIVVEAKENLKTIYDGAIARKTFQDISSSFTFKDGNLESLEKSYESLVNALKEKETVLQKIDFTDVAFGNVIPTKEGYLSVGLRISYTYTVSYQDGEEEKTSEKKNSSSIILIFAGQENQFHLVGMDNMETNFRK